MNSSAPALTIVPDTRPRQTGRRADIDIEASHPLGRWLHVQQGQVFGICVEAIAYRDTHRADRIRADAACDESIKGAERRVSDLLRDPNPETRQAAREVLACLADYWIADAREDAHAADGDGCVATMHQIGQRIAGAIDKMLAVVRRKR